MSKSNSSFKVVCIECPPHWIWQASKLSITYPKKDDIVTVIGVRPCDCGCGETMYIISEHNHGPAFSANCFAPITYSDITAEIAAKATETKEQPDKIVINEPVNN